MSKKNEKPAPGSKNWQSTAAIAVGSAAITAALLFATRRKEKPDKPLHPQDAPETD